MPECEKEEYTRVVHFNVNGESLKIEFAEGVKRVNAEHLCDPLGVPGNMQQPGHLEDFCLDPW